MAVYVYDRLSLGLVCVHQPPVGEYATSVVLSRAVPHLLAVLTTSGGHDSRFEILSLHEASRVGAGRVPVRSETIVTFAFDATHPQLHFFTMSGMWFFSAPFDPNVGDISTFPDSPNSFNERLAKLNVDDDTVLAHRLHQINIKRVSVSTHIATNWNIPLGFACFSTHGDRLLLGCTGEIVVVKCPTRMEIGIDLPKGTHYKVPGLDGKLASDGQWDPFSPSYVVLVSSMGQGLLYDLETKKDVLIFGRKGFFTEVPSGPVGVAGASLKDAATWPVRSMMFIPDMPGVLVSRVENSDGLVVWNVSQPDPLRVLTVSTLGLKNPGSTSRLTSSVHVPGTTHVLTAGFDGSVSLVDADMGQRVWRVEVGHTKTVFEATFAIHNPHTLVSASFDGTVRVWDNRGGPLRSQLVLTTLSNREPYYSCAISPDGNWIVAGGGSGRVIFYNCLTQQVERTLDITKDAVLQMSFSADGDYLAWTSDDNYVVVMPMHSDVSGSPSPGLDPTNGLVINSRGTFSEERITKVKHRIQTRGLAWSPAELGLIATINAEGLLRVSRVGAWHVAAYSMMHPHSKKARVVTVPPPASPPKPSAGPQLDGDHSTPPLPPSPLYESSLAPRDFGDVAVGMSAQPDLSSQASPTVLPRSSSVAGFALTWNRALPNLVLSVHDDGTAVVWHVPVADVTPAGPHDGGILVPKSSCVVLNGHTSNARACAWVPGLAHVCVTGAWDATIRLWDIRNGGSCLSTFQIHMSDVFSLTVTPIRPLVIVSASRDATLRVSSLDTSFVASLARGVLGWPILAEMGPARPTRGRIWSGPVAEHASERLEAIVDASRKRRRGGDASSETLLDDPEALVDALEVLADVFMGNDGTTAYVRLLREVAGFKASSSQVTSTSGGTTDGVYPTPPETHSESSTLASSAPGVARATLTNAHLTHYTHIQRRYASVARAIDARMSAISRGVIGGAAQRRALATEALEAFLLAGDLAQAARMLAELGRWEEAFLLGGGARSSNDPDDPWKSILEQRALQISRPGRHETVTTEYQHHLYHALGNVDPLAAGYLKSRQTSHAFAVAVAVDANHRHANDKDPEKITTAATTPSMPLSWVPRAIQALEAQKQAAANNYVTAAATKLTVGDVPGALDYLTRGDHALLAFVTAVVLRRHTPDARLFTLSLVQRVAASVDPDTDLCRSLLSHPELGCPDLLQAMQQAVAEERGGKDLGVAGTLARVDLVGMLASGAFTLSTGGDVSGGWMPPSLSHSRRGSHASLSFGAERSSSSTTRAGPVAESRQGSDFLGDYDSPFHGIVDAIPPIPETPPPARTGPSPHPAAPTPEPHNPHPTSPTNEPYPTSAPASAPAPGPIPPTSLSSPLPPLLARQRTLSKRDSSVASPLGPLPALKGARDSSNSLVILNPESSASSVGGRGSNNATDLTQPSFAPLPHPPPARADSGVSASALHLNSPRSTSGSMSMSMNSVNSIGSPGSRPITDGPRTSSQHASPNRSVSVRDLRGRAPWEAAAVLGLAWQGPGAKSLVDNVQTALASSTHGHEVPMLAAVALLAHLLGAPEASAGSLMRLGRVLGASLGLPLPAVRLGSGRDVLGATATAAATSYAELQVHPVTRMILSDSQVAMEVLRGLQLATAAALSIGIGVGSMTALLWDESAARLVRWCSDQRTTGSLGVSLRRALLVHRMVVATTSPGMSAPAIVAGVGIAGENAQLHMGGPVEADRSIAHLWSVDWVWSGPRANLTFGNALEACADAARVDAGQFSAGGEYSGEVARLLEDRGSLYWTDAPVMQMSRWARRLHRPRSMLLMPAA